MKENSQMLKILECLDLEGALTNKEIAEITGVPSGTVRCYTSLLTRGGFLSRYKDMRGIYELTTLTD